ncbi:MAG: hypothetical protein VKP70_00145 [Cyanobacteriota bacterium]|nr:hypothetical protein [Cyanobacteriota bacterium]
MPDLPWAVSLSEQIKTLSELVETLTYKMLELEERCAAHQEQLTARQQAAERHTAEMVRAIDGRIGETEDRLGRIELLLRPERQPSGSPLPLRALAKPVAMGKRGSEAMKALGEEADPFAPSHVEAGFDDHSPLATGLDDQSLAS